ncbi:hypothetical protein PJ15_1050 [Acinetobacter sp. neg1]|nr:MULTISPECIES: hypothetical protein [Acinetobacter]KHF77993.1 hypothetical protein PJ15_1050 [Acinetobacter sp. neg1]
MNIIKFLKSFNTIGAYLIVASVVLVILILYFYFINPN